MGEARDTKQGMRGGPRRPWERRGMGGMRYVTWGKLRYMGREITLIARGDSKGEEKGGGAGRNSRAGLRQVFCGVPRTRRPLLLFTLAKRVDDLSAGVTEYVLSSPRLNRRRNWTDGQTYI